MISLIFPFFFCLFLAFYFIFFFTYVCLLLTSFPLVYSSPSHLFLCVKSISHYNLLFFHSYFLVPTFLFFSMLISAHPHASIFFPFFPSSLSLLLLLMSSLYSFSHPFTLSLIIPFSPCLHPYIFLYTFLSFQLPLGFCQPFPFLLLPQ